MYSIGLMQHRVGGGGFTVFQWQFSRRLNSPCPGFFLKLNQKVCKLNAKASLSCLTEQVSRLDDLPHSPDKIRTWQRCFYRLSKAWKRSWRQARFKTVVVSWGHVLWPSFQPRHISLPFLMELSSSLHVYEYLLYFSSFILKIKSRPHKHYFKKNNSRW